MSRGCAAVVLAALSLGASRPPSLDDALAAFWSAATVDAAARAVPTILATGAEFDAVYARLKAGRPYRPDVPRGVQRLVRRAGAAEFPYTIDVPSTYDASRRYQVRVHLHGGVGRPTPAARGDGSLGALAGGEQIYVMPQAWAGAEWWTAVQDENLAAILDTLKRGYNVDENRVVLSGVSDGGTGAFYVAMRNTTPYASFLPLNGFILVLRNGDLGIAGGLYPHNLMNKPFFAVNGGQDPLYPAARVEPILRHFAAGGLRLEYRPQPDAGHNTAWWPTVRDDFERFVREHPREPHPARLTWRTEIATHSSRAHWLVVDRLTTSRASEGDPLPDLNDVASGEATSFGVRGAGMRISEVAPGSNAHVLGLRSGDVVRRVNGRELPEALGLEEFLGIYSVGDALTMDLLREGRSVSVSGTYAPTAMRRATPLFTSSAPSGRVDLERDGNTIRATTRGVAAFTLLLSPDVIDFARPVTVVANGVTVFNGVVRKDIETLVRWAARDNDRTMLYAAALPIEAR